MENEQSDTPDTTEAAEAVEALETLEAVANAAATSRRRYRKKGKIDEVLKSIRLVVDGQKKLTEDIVQELRVLTSVGKSLLLKLPHLEKLGDLAVNIYGCAVNPNGFVVAAHAELVKLNQAVESLKGDQQANGNRASTWHVQPSLGGPQPWLPPGAPPGYSAPPPLQAPLPPPESVVSMLTDIPDQQKYKLARDLGLFVTSDDEDEFMRTDGLRQAAWISDRAIRHSIVAAVIKARVEENRKYRNGGNKNKKL